MSWIKLSRLAVFVALAVTTSECGGNSSGSTAAVGGSTGSAGAPTAGTAGTADSQPPVCGIACTGMVNCPGLTSFTGTAYVAGGACVLEIHASFGSGTKNALTCDNQLVETDLGPDPGTGFSGTWTGSGSTVTIVVSGATVTCNITP
jgi:hypothetical protein